MRKNKMIITGEKQAKEQFRYEMPLVFSMPRPYEDAIIERDKELYAKVQNLKIGYENLKTELLNYSKIYEERYTQTRHAIQISKSLLEKFINKRKTFNQGIKE